MASGHLFVLAIEWRREFVAKGAEKGGQQAAR